MGSLNSKNNYVQNLRAGELVEVRSQKEILATLDENGRLEMLPFMPEMLKYCGKRVRVFKRADKTCDTIEKSGLRRMENSVHLEGLRCDGGFHGGCQAGCLIFWKEAWLKRVKTGLETQSENGSTDSFVVSSQTALQNEAKPCTEETLFKATRVALDATGSDGETYSCQTTELRKATSYLSKWDIGQYIRDVRSGNIRLLELGRGMCLLTFNALIRTIHHLVGIVARCLGGHIGTNTGPTSGIVQAVCGESRPSSPVDVAVQRLRLAVRRVLDLLVEYPHIRGKLCKTPAAFLHLQPGELVQVKSKKEIAQSLNIHSSNRGLGFNVEMLPYCGGQYRVSTRVEQIINEKTGKMMRLPNDCIILDGVTCRAYYHKFCPRNIYPYWREIWLTRVNGRDAEPKVIEKQKSSAAV